jgi:hypothetical protein
MRAFASVGSVVVLALAAAFTAAACGPAPETLCKRLCDCGSCAAQEEEGCAESLGDAEKEASDGDCGAEYDAYVSCLDENLECKGGAADTSDCEDEHEALVECLDEPVILLVGDGCVDLCEEVAVCAGIDVANCQIDNICTYEQNRCAACLAGSPADLCNPEELVNAALPCLDACLAAFGCEPGSTTTCTCADGAEGTSTCNGTTYGPCTCAEPQ